MLLVDLNFDFRAPRTEREEIIADLIYKMNLVEEEERNGPGDNEGGDTGINPLCSVTMFRHTLMTKWSWAVT
jgi:hypothetical protein